ncbi:nuclear transport factor 2 family protein [Mycolicibacterium moriokaense]|nr:nuclear transport factor 2 family protein [Mycolicibacterium moriokaense]
MSVEETVLGMWKALSDRDWEAVKTYLAEDCLYVDMPIPAAAARGPEDIVTRLKIGLESLSSYENHKGMLLTNGVDVMYEHSETWGWDTGETVRLCFVSVHRVEDGKITLWKDYSDFNTLMSKAPQSYLQGWDSVDTSWVVDASDLV